MKGGGKVIRGRAWEDMSVNLQNLHSCESSSVGQFLALLYRASSKIALTIIILNYVQEDKSVPTMKPAIYSYVNGHWLWW